MLDVGRSTGDGRIVIRLGPKVALAQIVPLLAVFAIFAQRGSGDMALAGIGPALPWSSIGAGRSNDI
jgi:hypothetical protein